MRAKIPASTLRPGHQDFKEVDEISSAIIHAAGGIAELKTDVGELIRSDIDVVIDTPRTGRCSYDELEKTEKTYIGTRLEIGLRALLGFPKGKLDLRIETHDVDIKFTGGNNWMIPKEALGNFCILLAADEKLNLYHLGVFRARPEYLNNGENRDGKKTISTVGFANINWLAEAKPYRANFWRAISANDRAEIFSRNGGTDRIVALFKGLTNVPIDRAVIESVARQKDYMKRLRGNGGARDKLTRAGLVLLSGRYDSEEIKRRQLPRCTADEFICAKALRGQ